MPSSIRLPMLLTLVGCAMPLRNGEDAPALDRKTVTQTILPDTLVASDGTHGTTSTGKFSKTPLRTDAWCIWLVPPRPGGMAPR